MTQSRWQRFNHWDGWDHVLAPLILLSLGMLDGQLHHDWIGPRICLILSGWVLFVYARKDKSWTRVGTMILGVLVAIWMLNSLRSMTLFTEDSWSLWCLMAFQQLLRNAESPEVR